MLRETVRQPSQRKEKESSGMQHLCCQHFQRSNHASILSTLNQLTIISPEEPTAIIHSMFSFIHLIFIFLLLLKGEME